MKNTFLKITAIVLSLSSFSAGLLAFASIAAPNTKPAPIIAQAEDANPAEFTLTKYSNAALGLDFQRPTSWTQDSSFKGGVRFAGGDEWLELRIVDNKTTAEAYSSAYKLPTGETKLGIKPFKDAKAKFSASVLSSKSVGSSSITGKPLDLLTDRWVFALKAGKLVVLTVTGPKKVFDWEGNRDMALSVRLK